MRNKNATLAGGICLLMIPLPGEDGEGAVGGFGEEDAHELVGEGEAGDREAEVGGGFDLGGKTVGGADDEGDLTTLVTGIP